VVELKQLLKTVRATNRLLDTWNNVPHYLYAFKDSLVINRPSGTSAVIVLPRRTRGEMDWTNFVAIHRHRTPFSVVEKLARVLGPTALQTGIIPMIHPVEERAFEGMTMYISFVRAIQSRGLMLYEEGQGND
jgi:hypothetical protein